MWYRTSLSRSIHRFVVVAHRGPGEAHALSGAAGSGRYKTHRRHKSSCDAGEKAQQDRSDLKSHSFFQGIGTVTIESRSSDPVTDEFRRRWFGVAGCLAASKRRANTACLGGPVRRWRGCRGGIVSQLPACAAERPALPAPPSSSAARQRDLVTILIFLLLPASRSAQAGHPTHSGHPTRAGPCWDGDPVTRPGANASLGAFIRARADFAPGTPGFVDFAEDVFVCALWWGGLRRLEIGGFGLGGGRGWRRAGGIGVDRGAAEGRPDLDNLGRSTRGDGTGCRGAEEP
jgi:hypothetical protein